MWRGNFLDATPMWNNRGNGVSLPMGMVVYVNSGDLLLLNSTYQKSDTELESKGYEILGDGELVFTAETETGELLRDHLKLLEDGRGIQRNLDYQGSDNSQFIQVSEGTGLMEISSGLYLLENPGLYLQIHTSGVTPQSGTDGIYLPVNSKISYSLLF